MTEEITEEIEGYEYPGDSRYPYEHGFMDNESQISSLATITANPKIVAVGATKNSAGNMKAVILWKNDIPSTSNYGYTKLIAKKTGSTSQNTSRTCASSGVVGDHILYRKTTMSLSEVDPVATTIDVLADNCSSIANTDCAALYANYWGFDTETGPLSPNGYAKIDTAEFHSGTKSAKIEIPGTVNKNSPSIGSNSMVAIPSTSYTLKAWGKVLGIGGGSPGVRAVEFRTSLNNWDWNNQHGIYWGITDTAWAQKTLTFTTFSDTTKVYVYGNIWAGYGTFWFDDVELMQGITTTNMVANPGFESVYTYAKCIDLTPSMTDSRTAIPLTAYSSTGPGTPVLSLTPGDHSMTINVGAPTTGEPTFAYYITIWNPDGTLYVNGYIPVATTSITISGLLSAKTYAVFVQTISRSDVWGGITIESVTPLPLIPCPTCPSPTKKIALGVAGGIILGWILKK